MIYLSGSECNISIGERPLRKVYVGSTLIYPYAGTVMDYGPWILAASASSEVIAAGGGTSTVTATAHRTRIYADGSTDEEVATPTLAWASSGGYEGFTLSCAVVTAANRGTTLDAARTCIVRASIDSVHEDVLIAQQPNAKELSGITPSAPAWTGTPAGETVALNVMANYTYTSGSLSSSDVTSAATFEITHEGFSVDGANSTVTSEPRGAEVVGSRMGILYAYYKTENMATTATADVTLTQKANAIESYGDWVITLSATTTSIAAVGGTSTVSATAKRLRTYSSTSTDYENGTPTLAFVAASYTGFTFNTTSGIVTAADRMTTVGAARTCVVRATMGTITKDITITQVANAVTATTYDIGLSSPTGTTTATAVAASGGTVNLAVSGSITYTYTSNHTSGGSFTPTVTISGTTTSGFALNGTVVTVSNRSTVVGSVRNETVTATGNGVTKMLVLYQAANYQSFSSLATTCPSWTGSAAGETRAMVVTASYTYTSGATSSADVTSSSSLSTSSAGFSVDSTGKKVTSASRGTTTGAARTGTVTATYNY